MCRDEGVNIYNSPTMESSRDLRPSHSSIDNLAKNIYSQVKKFVFINLENTDEISKEWIVDYNFHP